MITESYPLSAGEAVVRNERTLLVGVESGALMQSTESVRFIVIHCLGGGCPCPSIQPL